MTEDVRLTVVRASADDNSVDKKLDLAIRIEELEKELAQKDQDLSVYRQELSVANEALEALMGNSDDILRQYIELQKFLVPTEFPNIPGFEFSTKFKSSRKAGGDYFDIFEHQDKMRFGVFLSSATGYGMSSLFLSVLMKLTFEIEDRKSRDPALVLQEIVGEIAKNTSVDGKFSIFYGIFDRRKFHLNYSNLGQGLCLYYQALTGNVELLSGPPRAFSPADPEAQSLITTETVTLNPRDKLIFCSNGFLGLKNAKGQTLGIETLLSTIKKHGELEVHGLRNELFFVADQYADHLEQDLTAIVLEVKDRILKLASD